MKSKLIFLLIIFISLISFVSAAHCWDNEGINTTLAQSASATFSNSVDLPLGQSIGQDGNIATKVVMINSTMHIDVSGQYVFHCNNGVQEPHNNYKVLTINGNFFCNNVENCAAPIGLGDLPYCDNSTGTRQDSSDLVGLGNQGFIFRDKTFTAADTGILKYEVISDSKAIKNHLSINIPQDPPLLSENVFVAGYPSLLIFGPEDTKTGFYENDGNYQRDVIFTVRSEHVLDINLMDYSINCTGIEVTCNIDSSQKGYILDRTNNTVMLFGTIIVNKNNIPKNIFVDLNVHYQLTQLKNLQAYSQGHYTSSKPTKMEVGLLDKQQFQVKIKSDKEMFNCAGADGTIGQTGPDFAPRINLTFGGNDDSRTVSLDECNPKDTNWVYCSQSEFIVSLSRKIAEIATKQSQLSSAMQASDKNQTFINTLNQEINDLENFEIATRDINVSTSNLTSSINYINNQLSVLTNGSGLEGYSSEASFGGSETSKQVARMRSLFTGSNKIKFTSYGGDITTPKFDAGTYTVAINFISSNGSFELFDPNNQFDSDLTIIIDLKQKSLPAYNWFFYENGIEDVLSEIEASEPTIGNSNVTNRGAIFRFEHTDNNNDLSTSTLWKTFATPLFTKISQDGNDSYNNFTISKDGGIEGLVDDTFTYWTGFASTKGQGCEDISPVQTDGYLVYNTPDKLLSTSASARINVEISEYNYIDVNTIEYLQSVIYLPYNFEQRNNVTLTMDGNLLLTTPNSTCTTLPCKLEIKASNTVYKINNLQEVFDNIVSGKVCVSEERNGNRTNWKLFWNENEILKNLNAKKALITDADLCEARLISDN